MGLLSYKPYVREYCLESFNIDIPNSTIQALDTSLAILITAKYMIISVNFVISILILAVTRFCNIPGRIFRLFIYNTYGLNLIALFYFVFSEIFGEDFDGPMVIVTYLMGFGAASAYTALSTVLPYTCVRFYFIVGFKIFEDSITGRKMLFYTLFYNISVGAVFYIAYIFHAGDFINLSEEPNSVLISIYAMSTLQGLIVVSSIAFIICTNIYINNTSMEQKFLMATRESLPDRQKIVRICIIQIVLYAIQAMMEVARFIETLNQRYWFCSPVFIYTLHYSRRLVQQLCMIIFALVIMCCLNAYKKAFREMWGTDGSPKLNSLTQEEKLKNLS